MIEANILTRANLGTLQTSVIWSMKNVTLCLSMCVCRVKLGRPLTLISQIHTLYCTVYSVERLYCKRPILCLSSSKILTPYPPLPLASVYPVLYIPPALVRGEDTLAGWRKGWGVNILEDARHSSVLYICKFTWGGYTPVLPEENC